MPNPDLKGQISVYDYLSFDGKNETLAMLGGNMQLSSRVNMSLSAGIDCVYDEGFQENKLGLEAKAKYKINKNLSTQARFRKIGDSEQYRVTFGSNFPISSNKSIYVTAHLTAKDSDKLNFNTGGWIGYTQKLKDGASISCEVQQNFQLNKTAPNFKKTLGCFDDSNKIFNVILTIPIQKL